jgi:lysozyme family protein
MPIEDVQKTLASLSINQLQAIQADPDAPEELCEAAEQLEQYLLSQSEKNSYRVFQAGTAEFVTLTTQLLAIAQSVPPDSAVTLGTTITKLIYDSGDVALQKVGIFIDPQRGKTDDPPAIPANPPPAPSPAAPPVSPAADGAAVVLNSKNLQVLAPEYVDLFNRAKVNSGHLSEIANVLNVIVANRPLYESAGSPLTVPWYVVAVIHAMEGLNFGLHLHNGDSLQRRTVHEPVGRPQDGSPPFTWPQSAEDALKERNLDHVGSANWILSRTLYELEGYNGFGYRQFGKATPYLWSYCQHYDKGKYVADGEYDPDAVSRQCGAAVLLKQMEINGTIQIPR